MSNIVVTVDSESASSAIACGSLRQAKSVVSQYKHDASVDEIRVYNDAGTVILMMRGRWISSRGTSFASGNFRVLVDSDVVVECPTLRDCNDVVHQYKRRAGVSIIEVVDASKRTMNERLLAHYGPEWLRG